jgi:hypothetical protein
MHFMPYPDVAPGRPQGQWVDIPNQRFDPRTGHKLYKNRSRGRARKTVTTR